jgi:hypothetical protein
MISQQQATAHSYTAASVSHAFATAATRYQLFRELEAEQLAVMARENLLEEWSAQTRATVLAAREYVKDAREARTRFRAEVREVVLAFRERRQALPQVLRHTRDMLQSLERTGSIRSDDGWFEAEVLEWAIEEYESVS